MPGNPHPAHPHTLSGSPRSGSSTCERKMSTAKQQSILKLLPIFEINEPAIIHRVRMRFAGLIFEQKHPLYSAKFFWTQDSRPESIADMISAIEPFAVRS